MVLPSDLQGCLRTYRVAFGLTGLPSDLLVPFRHLSASDISGDALSIRAKLSLLTCNSTAAAVLIAFTSLLGYAGAEALRKKLRSHRLQNRQNSNSNQ